MPTGGPYFPFEREPGGRQPNSGDTSVSITGVSPASAKGSGGATITLTGTNLRNNGNGTPPKITVDGVTATGVVVLSRTSLTFTMPAVPDTGQVDIVITVDTSTATLHNSFVVWEETLLSISPRFGPLSGGTAVIISGKNFDLHQTYDVEFGDQLATNVQVIDSQTISCVTPASPIGFVDVTLLSPAQMFSSSIFSHTIFNIAPVSQSELAVMRLGFQYTLLIRGEDIRSTNGVQVSETLGQPPSTATFDIDGRSNAPNGGEKIQINDAYDSNRLIWAGVVQKVVQDYEGSDDQLVWHVNAVDFTWLMNAHRPFGSWFQTSASQIVQQLISQFCPGFTTNNVQTNLSKVTLICDGSQDMITVLNSLASAIGGGHWYCDYQQDIHFFHIQPTDVASVVPPDTPTATSLVQAGSYCTLAAGGPIPSTTQYLPGFYSLRVQFVYDDGTLSAVTPMSNLVYMNGTAIFNITNIPLGPTLTGKTCIKRRFWAHQLTAAAQRIYQISAFCDLNDNTTTSFTTWFNEQGASSPNVVAIPMISAYWQIPAVNIPDVQQANNPPAPPAPPSAVTVAQLNGDPSVWQANWESYRYAFLYRDGSISYASAPSAPIGDQYNQYGFMKITGRIGNLLPGPSLGPNNDCIARLVYSCYGILNVANFSEVGSGAGPQPGYGGGNPNYLVNDPDWINGLQKGVTCVPDNTTFFVDVVNQNLNTDFYGINSSSSHVPYFSENTTFTNINYLGTKVANGEDVPPFNPSTDANFAFTPDPVPAWPNTDGPYLEDAFPPTDLTDDNPYLLHQDAAQGFQTTTDWSQVRNRIFVFGSGSTLTQNYPAGATQVIVSDISNFALGGGQFQIIDPISGATEIGFYSSLGQSNGQPFVILKTPLAHAYSQGAVMRNYYRCDDLVSQAFCAKYELDTFGHPTSGVHEFSISDGSLKTNWQLYMAGQAQLELYSKPIITIQYSTTDPNTRIGRTVHVDMDNPPCLGDFLIQSVKIDQIRNEGSLLAPRYTAQACSVRYDLNDLLLLILNQAPAVSGGISVAGVAAAGASQGTAGGTIPAAASFPQNPFSLVWVQATQTSPPTLQGIGCSTGGASTLAFDPTETPMYQDDYNSGINNAQRQSNWAAATTTTSANNTASMQMVGCPAAFLEEGPDVWFEFKTPAVILGCGFWVGMFTSAQIPVTFAGTNVGICALRWFSGTDSGWTMFFQSQASAGGLTKTKVTGVSLQPSTHYIVRMQTQMSAFQYQTLQVIWSINGSQATFNWKEGALAMPTAGHATSNGTPMMSPAMGVVNITGTTVKKLNVRRIYATAVNVTNG